MTEQQGYRKITRVEKSDGGGQTFIYDVTANCKEIGEHMPRGPGDVCYYDIILKDDSMTRLYFPDVVNYSKPINLKLPTKPAVMV